MRKRMLCSALSTLIFFVICSTASASTNTTVTIAGTEQQISGIWDQGEITISFNGYSETVSYGQFSTASSIASAFAAMFSNDYLAYGLCAHASGAVITFHLKGSATFGPISVSGSSTSFSVGTSGWQSGAPAPPGPPANGSCQAKNGAEDQPDFLPDQRLRQVRLRATRGQMSAGTLLA